MVRVRMLSTFLVCPVVLAAQVFYGLNDAEDAATYMPGIAPGSIFVVNGNFPLPDQLRVSPLPLQQSLNGVSLTLTPADGGEPVRVWMLYLVGGSVGHSPQIAAVLPSTTRPGDYRTTLVTRNITVGPGRATVVERKYRSLTNNQEGTGLAVIQNYVSAARVDRNMFVAGSLADGQTKSPARPGQTVILWGLGLGPISGPDNAPPGPVDLRGSLVVKVAVGGVEAAVLYAGRSPEFPGIDQINFTIPADAPLGCNVAVQTTVNGAPANPATIAIAAPGEDSCPHPYLTRAQLDSLDNARTFMAGEFNLMVSVRPEDFGRPYAEIHSSLGYFDLMTAGRVSKVDYQSVKPGACTLWADATWFDVNASDSYDAGRLTLSGQNVDNLPYTDDDDYYFRMLSAQSEAGGRWLFADRTAQLVPGTYTLKGAGGSVVGAFEAAVELPVFFKWTDRDTFQAVDRGAGLTVNWTGGGSKDRVVVQGVSAVAAGNQWVTFVCAAPPGASSFTVPPAILMLLPENVNDGLQEAGFVSVAAFSATATSRFRAPLTAGGETGSGTLGYLMMTIKSTAYR